MSKYCILVHLYVRFFEKLVRAVCRDEQCIQAAWGDKQQLTDIDCHHHFVRALEQARCSTGWDSSSGYVTATS